MIDSSAWAGELTVESANATAKAAPAAGSRMDMAAYSAAERPRDKAANLRAPLGSASLPEEDPDRAECDRSCDREAITA